MKLQLVGGEFQAPPAELTQVPSEHGNGRAIGISQAAVQADQAKIP